MAERQLPPNYVRAVILKNAYNFPVQVKLFFDSGATEEHILAIGQERKFERGIDVGTSSIVDPVNKFTTSLVPINAPEPVSQSMVASGVEIRNYTIGGSFSLTLNK